jgi:hypothetical protein
MNEIKRGFCSLTDKVLWQDNDGEYYVTSYANSQWAHETMMFRADEDGEITSFSELACIRGGRHHEECVKQFKS